MKYIYTLLPLLAMSLGMYAQQQPPKDEKEREKLFYEAIQKEVDRYESTLALEGWQVFYVDSILTHNYSEMQAELDELSKSRVANSDLYLAVQDKWNEATYNAFHKYFDEQQWAKYLKTGGLRDRKAREKRAAKAVKK